MDNTALLRLCVMVFDVFDIQAANRPFTNLLVLDNDKVDMNISLTDAAIDGAFLPLFLPDEMRIKAQLFDIEIMGGLDIQ